jgi:RNA polymerase sigma factor (sigma-70 family)
VANHVAADDEIRSVVSSSDHHSELRGLVSALPERQRLAVFLRYYADLSYSQLGQALGVDPGTIAASLNAAHRTLRQQLEEQTELEVANETA